MERTGPNRAVALVAWSAVLAASAFFSQRVLAQVALVQQPLRVVSRSVWPNPSIPVCLEDDGFDPERDIVRRALTSTWEAVSNVRFTGWGRCGTHTATGLRLHFVDAYGIVVGDGRIVHGRTDGFGTALDNRVNGIAIASRSQHLRAVAVHEFGHALGFMDEQKRPDQTPPCPAKPLFSSPQGVTGAPFDVNSVMNDCDYRLAPERLSPGDVAGVRQFYGWSENKAYRLHSDDKRTDLVVWRPADGKWYELDRALNSGRALQWGQAGDVPVRMDADGDGLKDIVVWRPSEGNWYRITPSRAVTCSFSGPWYNQRKTCHFTPHRFATIHPVRQWGLDGDVPVPADYDGDGIDDYAVWRPSDGTWYVINSATNTSRFSRCADDYCGRPGDIPVPGDYNGDGRADFMLWRPSDGRWYSYELGLAPTQWGEEGAIPVPGDYNNDGRTDRAYWRPSDGTWFIMNSDARAHLWVQQWGAAGDIPVPADYDGDGRTDFATWRPSSGTWYVIKSSDFTWWLKQWGLPGDVPL